jgi:plasmid maintenance system antidote protein VapI
VSEIEMAIKAVQIYADMHPRPAHVTQVQAAEMIGISRETIRKMIRTGKLRMNAVGMIPIIEIDRALAPKAA